MFDKENFFLKALSASLLALWMLRMTNFRRCASANTRRERSARLAGISRMARPCTQAENAAVKETLTGRLCCHTARTNYQKAIRKPVNLCHKERRFHLLVLKRIHVRVLKKEIERMEFIPFKLALERPLNLLG
jgi:hypothetical protein